MQRVPRANQPKKPKQSTVPKVEESGVILPAGLARDAHHTAILSGLAGHLDPELLEACAADLLRQVYPTLTPVRGGSDQGYDGAIASDEEPPFPLIVTSGKDAKANLLRNLRQVTAHGSNPTRAVFATSRRLTPRARISLEAAARKLGVNWLQIHDQDWFANALYRDDPWARKLLNVSGRPSALSMVPLSARPMAGDVQIARQTELAAISDAGRDVVLVGAPGSGKTFLLQALARKRKALFLTDSNREALANAIRAQRPPTIVIDDAHVDPRIILTLRQLRKELGADFRIIAVSWPADAPHVQTQLDVPSNAIVELHDVDLDTMVEIVRAAGVKGPNEYIRMIVHQANGRPGLAATLAQLCLRGDAEHVWSGTSLAKDLLPMLSKLAGEDVAPLLACFALGGATGMSIDHVGGYLRRPLDWIISILARVGTAGILRPSQSGRTISVWPAVLRWVLVKRVFFGETGALDYTPLLSYVKKTAETAMTLLGAYSRGARVPELLELIEKADSADVWEAYASLGPKEARYVVEHDTKIALKIPGVLLATCPEDILPLLLDAAVGDTRELHSNPDHPLRRIQDWARSPSRMPGDREERAHNVIVAACQWWKTHGLQVEAVGNVAIHAFCLAFDPNWHSNEADPGRGHTFTLSHGTISKEEAAALLSIWHGHRHVLTLGTHTAWKHALSLVHEWHYGVPNIRLPATLSETRRKAGKQILQDVAESSRGQRGTQHQVRAIAHRLKYQIITEPDVEFDILFPFRESPKNWEQDHARWLQDARSLAPSWIAIGPTTCAARIVRIERDAQLAGITWPRLTVALLHAVADAAPQPADWFNALAEAFAPADLMRPFIAKMVASRDPAADTALRQCLDSASYTQLGAEVTLTTPTMSDALIDVALQKAEAFPNLIETWCLRDDFPVENLKRAMTAGSGALAVAAAIGEWCSAKHQKRSIRVPLVWRTAIVRSAHVNEATLSDLRDHWLADIFKADPSIALDWLIELSTAKNTLFDYAIHKLAKKALVVLDPAQRIAFLGRVDRESSLTSRIRALVGHDVEVYAALLARPDLADFHLAPLEGTPSPEWRAKAITALNAGYTKARVLGATRLTSWSWSGNMSEMWKERKRAFDAHLTDPDVRIAAIAREGAEEVTREIEGCLRKEREEAVHGRERRRH